LPPVFVRRKSLQAVPCGTNPSSFGLKHLRFQIADCRLVNRNRQSEIYNLQ
jgi:hypothetical protein